MIFDTACICTALLTPLKRNAMKGVDAGGLGGWTVDVAAISTGSDKALDDSIELPPQSPAQRCSVLYVDVEAFFVLM